MILIIFLIYLWILFLLSHHSFQLFLFQSYLLHLNYNYPWRMEQQDFLVLFLPKLLNQEPKNPLDRFF